MSVVWLGYLASGLIALSLTMTSIVRLRLINLCGASLFAVYGLLIGAYPVVVLNCLTVTLNTIFLLRLLKDKAKFRLLAVSAQSPYLHYFLEHYEKDIRTYFSDFRLEEMEKLAGYYVLRDLQIVGVMLGHLEQGGVFRVLLDYVPPAYQDYKAGHFLFHESEAIFREMGVKRIETQADNAAHARYLEKMGFVQETDHNGKRVFVCDVSTK